MSKGWLPGVVHLLFAALVIAGCGSTYTLDTNNSDDEPSEDTGSRQVVPRPTAQDSATVSFVSFNPRDQNPAYYRELAAGEFEAGDYQQAIEYYNYAIALQPNEVGHYLNRGRAYAQLQLYPLAADDYERALDLNVATNTMATYFYELGNVALNNQLTIQALHYFDRAGELNPNDARIYYVKARTYELSGNLQRAMENYERVITMDANLGYNILLHWGSVAQNTRSYQQAVEYLDRAVQLQPNNPVAYRQRAVNRYYLGQGAQTEADLQRALELNPADPEVYRLLGWYYENEENPTLAQAYYQRAQDLTPQS